MNVKILTLCCLEAFFLLSSSIITTQVHGRSNGLFGGGGDLTALLIGFLLAQTATASSGKKSSSRFLGALGERQPVLVSPNGRKPLPLLTVPKETVEKVRELRKQNGFGFLWGRSIAKKLKALAEANEHKMSQRHDEPAAIKRRSTKVHGYNFHYKIETRRRGA